MAPSVNVERRMVDGQSGTVTIAILVSIGSAIIIALLAIIILVVLRRKKYQNDDIPYGVPYPLRTHKSKASESFNPLLKGDWDHPEKVVAPVHEFTNVVSREAREDHGPLSNDPSGVYRLPSARTLPPLTPTPSSHCLHPGHETNFVSDYHAPPVPPKERPPLPPLPRLIIPDSPQFVKPQRPAVVDEERSLVSHSSSTSSLYSQATADQTPPRPGYFEVSLSQDVAYEASRSKETVHRGETQIVGTLLKARAQRNPKGLGREPSHISHIERSGSIKTISTIHQDNRPYAKRYRSKKSRTNSGGDMEAVKETSEVGSHRSPTSSAIVAWESIQLPPRVAFSGALQPLRAF